MWQNHFGFLKLHFNNLPPIIQLVIIVHLWQWGLSVQLVVYWMHYHHKISQLWQNYVNWKPLNAFECHGYRDHWHGSHKQGSLSQWKNETSQSYFITEDSYHGKDAGGGTINPYYRGNILYTALNSVEKIVGMAPNQIWMNAITVDGGNAQTGIQGSQLEWCK